MFNCNKDVVKSIDLNILSQKITFIDFERFLQK